VTVKMYVRLFAVPGAGALCTWVLAATDDDARSHRIRTLSVTPSEPTDNIMARQQLLTAAMILCCCGGSLIVSALDINRLYGHIHYKRNTGTLLFLYSYTHTHTFSLSLYLSLLLYPTFRYVSPSSFQCICM
jgi:hypothetical protein